MTVSRPPVLRVGDEIRCGGGLFMVAHVSSSQVRLVSRSGVETAVAAAGLFTDPTFSIVSLAAPVAPLPPQALLDGLAADVVEQAREWERHVLDVLTPARALGSDLASGTLRQRELAKVAELRAAGRPVGLRTFQRIRRRYQTEGLWGLVDGRATRGPVSPTGRVDPRVVAAAKQAIVEQTSASTGTAARLRRRTEQLLAAEHGLDPAAAAVLMPSRATFYRLTERLTCGRHTLGSARTRRSLAKRPTDPFGTVTALRPGEWMQIDSSPLNVAAVLDDGQVERIELTWLIDQATKTIPAAVLRPSTKAVDAALLLARALTPEPMRPGWSDALAMSRSVLPHARLAAIDDRLRDAVARPVIVPETIVCDHGMVYLSQAFRNACRAIGITFQPTHPGSPWEKGTVETSFHAVDTLFAQYIAGYLGNSVENRGQKAEQQAVWSILELQALLDEWLVAVWANRAHDGLRDPLMPGEALTPNEKYAALVETAGYVPVPLSGDDYVELLPVTWRAINAYGVKINRRTYNSDALTPYRRQPSGVTAKNNLWEIHHDPYDVSRIWVRDHHDHSHPRGGGWITVPWTHLITAPAPFGDLAWDHARRTLARRGQDPATETEIAEAVNALLDTAGHGPNPDDGDHSGRPAATAKQRRQDRRVVARTRATTGQTTPWSPPSPAQPALHLVDGTDADLELDGLSDEADEATDDLVDLATVTPLPIFDAWEEAKKWW